MISLKQSPHPTQHSQFMALRINLGQRHSIRDVQRINGNRKHRHSTIIVGNGRLIVVTTPPPQSGMAIPTMRAWSETATLKRVVFGKRK